MLRRSSLVVVLAFACATAGCSQYGEKLEFGSGEVYYGEGVTKEEAQKLGDWLTENGYFADDDVTRSVQLLKEGDVYQVRFVVQPDAVDKPDIQDGFQAFADVVGTDVFDGAPAEIHLTDENLETLRVIEPSEKLQFGSGEVLYTNGATEEDAQKLGDWLTENGFFADDGVTRSVQLRKEADVYQVRFVVQPDAADRPEILEAFQVFADAIGADVFEGSPAEIHLINENLETLRVIEPSE